MWVKMKQSVVHEDKGYLEKDKSYNLPRVLAEVYIKEGIAEDKKEGG